MRRVAGFCAAVCLSLTLLSGLIWVAGTHGGLMCALMRRVAPSSDTGLPDAEYPAVAGVIAGFLAGREPQLQHTFTENGAEYLCFNVREQAHMADCRHLFALCRRVLIVSAAGCLLCAAYLAWRRCFPRRQILIGLAVLPCAALLPLVAALLSFDTVFLLFHRLSFANDLWLLDPRTDLLIRLMPTPFFTTLAGGIAGAWLLLSVVLAVTAARRKQAGTME